MDKKNVESRDLLNAWRSGDQSAKNKLIELNMDLVRTTAQRFVKKYGCDIEDAESAGQSALFNSAESLLKASTDNPRGYLTKCIKNAILAELQETWERNETEEDFNSLAYEDEPYVFESGFEEVDTWDGICSCCETTGDLQIVELKNKYRPVAEIAMTMRSTPSTVYYGLSKIGKRYRERYGANSSTPESMLSA